MAFEQAGGGGVGRGAHDHEDGQQIDDVRQPLLRQPLGRAQRAAAMGAAGLTRAKTEFSWATIAQDTVNIYKGLMR